MKGENSETLLYKQAMKEMDSLAQEVIERCNDFAENNHYEKSWVLHHFSLAFNRAKKGMDEE